jgi:uncharacterized protein involved in exopolysaccharide biosynthesis/Mrp family chromosome partitioning ATPase
MRNKQMSTSRDLEPSAGISPADIYFVIFRHKWKILILTALGLAAATVFYFVKQPLYQSDAQLFIRYISDSRAQNTDKNSQVTSMTDLGENVISSEMAILRSADIAAEAATNIGPEKILAKVGGGHDPMRAAAVIYQNLTVQNKIAGSVINITFRHPDSDMVRPVLAEVIADYKERHVQVHKAIGMSDDMLSDETSKLSLEIAQTEDELRVAKTNAGIISITDAERADQELSSRIRAQLLEARTVLAQHQSYQQTMANSKPAQVEVNTNASSTNSIADVPADKLANYKFICSQLSSLEKRQEDYIQQGFTDQNKRVKENRLEMVAATDAKKELEKEYPALLDSDVVSSGTSPDANSTSAADDTSKQFATLPSKIKELEAQFQEIQSEAAKLNEAETKISDLERRKKIQEANYESFISMLEQARIDEAMGPGRVSNIAVIQQPSPPYKDFGKFYKAVGLLAFGGFLAGLVWAFLIEFYLDRSVKRPVDLQGGLKIPFFLSIPDLNHNQRNRLSAPERRQLGFNGEAKSTDGNGNGALEIASPTINHALHSHYDALRDRLVNYFESINLTRKPKLVAVTSTKKGAGVSTIAAGLAASLSETGDGRVLLVDMNLENGAAQQFVRGQPGCQLDDALLTEKRDSALVQENLYVVSEGTNADKLPRILPKRFASLVPKLKASDYDYIIFDMPPVTQTSVTTRLAGFMDTVMLIVESEKTDRDVVQQAHQLLQQSKANVTAVLNKTRKYIPARLQHDIHADM